MKKKQSSDKIIRNKRASFDYALGDSFILGIALTGRETKALRLGRGQLVGAYVTVKDGELWLLNAQIHGSNGIPIDETEVTRTRKLLAKRKEIEKLIAAKQQGLSIVPTQMLTKGRFIKLKVAIGKGKKSHDKRQAIKERDDNRSVNRILARS